MPSETLCKCRGQRQLWQMQKGLPSGRCQLTKDTEMPHRTLAVPPDESWDLTESTWQILLNEFLVSDWIPNAECVSAVGMTSWRHSEGPSLVVSTTRRTSVYFSYFSMFATAHSCRPCPTRICSRDKTRLQRSNKTGFASWKRSSTLMYCARAKPMDGRAQKLKKIVSSLLVQGIHFA